MLLSGWNYVLEHDTQLDVQYENKPQYIPECFLPYLYNKLLLASLVSSICDT